MAFIYDENTLRAKDNSIDAEIRRDAGFRDCIDTSAYILRVHDLQIAFEVVASSIPYTYYTHSDSAITGLPKGSEQKSYVDDAVYIIEQDFRSGLKLGLQKIGRPDPTEEGYGYYKQILADGLVPYFTRNGKTLSRIPDQKFRIEFVEDLKSLAAIRPELVQSLPAHQQKP
jgi:hypothetical protein